MYGLSILLAGLCVAHALWLICYVTGTLLDAHSPRPATPAAALAELVARTAGGIALWGFGGFALGILGVLNIWGIAALFGFFVIAGRYIYKKAFFSVAFWREQRDRVGGAWTSGNLFTYYLALITIVPAIYPDVASDSVRYHLAYAADWAAQSKIYTDEFLTLPFFANNFVLVYALLEALHGSIFVHFAIWVCAALSALGVRACVTMAEPLFPPPSGRLEAASRATVGILLPAAIVISPAFLHWVNTALIDVPIEAFAFIPALCATAAFAARRNLCWTSVVCAGFTIGMKMTLIAFVPLYVGLIWASVSALGGTRRTVIVACAAMMIAAAPWYVRNLILDHDPIPPVINSALHHHDVIWSDREIKRVTGLSDLRPDRSLRALATLPYRIWADPLQPFREYGNVGLNLFLYVPVVFVGGALMFGVRGKRAQIAAVLCTTSAYGVVYLIMTAYLGRYLLMVQPPLAASIGVLLYWIPGIPAGSIARVAAALIATMPTPSGMTLNWYHEELGSYADVEYFPTADAVLLRNLPGYGQVLALLMTPEFKMRPAKRVLLLRADVQYYLHREGIETIGDWNGPGRYMDFVTALENDRLGDYVRHFNIGGVIMLDDASLFPPTQQTAIRTSFQKLGFRIVDAGEGHFVAVRGSR